MQEIYDTERPLAFRERCEGDLPQATLREQEQRQWEYFIATTFCDLWSQIFDKNGVVIGAFMSFYVCLANRGSTSVKCGTVICSKLWDRLKDDPLASGQRYYCNCCFARYRQQSGTLIQIQAPGCSPSFCRATIPPRDCEDVKAMWLEEELDPENPQVLYDRLPCAEPHADGTFLRVALPHEIVIPTKTPGGIFKILDVDAFLKMPVFPWQQMFNMFTEG